MTGLWISRRLISAIAAIAVATSAMSLSFAVAGPAKADEILYPNVPGPHKPLPAGWRNKVDMKSGDISRPFPFEPGAIEVYHAPGKSLTDLIAKYGLTGPASLVHPPKTDFELRAGLDRKYRVLVPAGQEKATVTRLAAAKEDFLYVGLFWVPEPYRPAVSPNDAMFQNNFQGNLYAIDMPRAWDRTVSFNGVRIGVIDTGFTGTHEEAVGKHINGYDFVAGRVTAIGENNDFGCTKNPPDPGRKYVPGHGTQMATQAAGGTNNGVGIAATGFNSVILPIRYWRDDCVAATFLGTAVSKAEDLGANVVNMSLSGDDQDLIARNLFETGSTQYGRIYVAAAGNDNTDVPQYPCAFPYVLCVGASDNVGARAAGSNYGNHVDYAAPRLNIWSGDRDSNNDYASVSGSSISTAEVSGIAGLFRSLGCTSDQTHSALAVTTSPHPDGSWTAFGFVNAGRALWYFSSC